jgi:hypothetical protein
MKKTKITLMTCFAEIEDPRNGPAQLHKLEDNLMIALCGVICGTNDWANIKLFGQAKKEWLETFLELPNGIPSHDTFGRVFRQLDPEQFEQGFLKWIRSVQKITKGEIVAVDGKKLRRSHDGFLGKDAIWMVDAWASENQITLGQRKVNDKSSSPISPKGQLNSYCFGAPQIFSNSAIGYFAGSRNCSVRQSGFVL